MTSLALHSVLSLALVLLPGAVFVLAARRLVMSRSRNAVLYWLAGGFAFAGGAGAFQTGLMGVQVDAGGMVIALASLPLWLLVRIATARTAAAYGAERLVFTSVRRGLQARAGSATSVP
ncbi:MAG: hypothetical protein MUF63_06830 [Rhodobacteraceae bacterium]|jgi:hypothetical protein|nr:hypothetical protein [Paracoccaceae bacterium]